MAVSGVQTVGLWAASAARSGRRQGASREIADCAHEAPAGVKNLAL